MQLKTAIGLDIGRSAVKVVANAGGLYYRLTFPSLVCPAFHLSDDAERDRAEKETVEIEGKRYFTGDTARVQGGVSVSAGLSHDWIKGPEYMALVASALKRLAQMSVPGLDSPYLVIGTPSKTYGQQKDILAEQTAKVVPAEMKVLPQPMGAYLSFFMDQRGLPLKDRQFKSNGAPRSWAIIEIGHYTTDFWLMREGRPVERVADSCEGVHFAAERLERLLDTKGIESNLLSAEEALRTGLIVDMGEKEVKKEAAEAVDFVTQKIWGKAKALLSTEVRTLDGVLLAGGGAPLFFESMKAEWSHTILLDNPRMAVADGFCRYGVGQLVRKAMLAEKASASAA